MPLDVEGEGEREREREREGEGGRKEERESSVPHGCVQVTGPELGWISISRGYSPMTPDLTVLT